MEKYKNLREKYDLTVEEIDRAVDEICKHGIGRACCDGLALVAVVDLMSSGDVPAQNRDGEDE